MPFSFIPEVPKIEVKKREMNLFETVVKDRVWKIHSMLQVPPEYFLLESQSQVQHNYLACFLLVA